MPTVPTIDAKPFYAYVGAADEALETLRTRVTTLPAQLKAVPQSLNTLSLNTLSLKTLPASLKPASTQLQGQVAQLPVFAASLPAQVKELQATFEKRYSSYVTRGEKVVAELRGGKAKATATKPASKLAAAAKPAPKKPAAKKTAPVAATSTPTVTPAVPAPATETVSQNGVPSQAAQTS